MGVVVRYKVAGFLINLGIRCLPEEYRTEKLISNLMKTGHIKVKRDLQNKED